VVINKLIPTVAWVIRCGMSCATHSSYLVLQHNTEHPSRSTLLPVPPQPCSSAFLSIARVESEYVQGVEAVETISPRVQGED